MAVAAVQETGRRAADLEKAASALERRAALWPSLAFPLTLPEGEDRAARAGRWQKAQSPDWSPSPPVACYSSAGRSRSWRWRRNPSAPRPRTCSRSSLRSRRRPRLPRRTTAGSRWWRRSLRPRRRRLRTCARARRACTPRRPSCRSRWRRLAGRSSRRRARRWRSFRRRSMRSLRAPLRSAPRSRRTASRPPSSTRLSPTLRRRAALDVASPFKRKHQCLCRRLPHSLSLSLWTVGHALTRQPLPVPDSPSAAGAIEASGGDGGSQGGAPHD